jgi:hypothetical protein
MVRAGNAKLRKEFAGKLAEASLHAIADNSVADLAADRITHALLGCAVGTIADEQDKTGHGRTLAGVGGKKVGALG